MRLRSELGVFGAWIAWSAYAVILGKGLSAVMIYADEYGSGCGTGGFSARLTVTSLVPIVLIVGGAGWGLALAAKSYARVAGLGFFGVVLTSFFCLEFTEPLLRAIIHAFR